ncbi:putative nuclease HARBI1 [Pleurodeles waltl]|uniref:putative nuclease HARBI1 n=1 Tax=Pleurodeles waltl TaxID=8319 RepID=UPI0037094C13
MSVLLFLATRSFQITVALTAGMPQPMFSLVFKDVLTAMLKHLNSYICFPQREDFGHVKTKLYGLAYIIHVVEAIDGTHVALVPMHGNEKVYRNKKNYHSIKVQVVCLENLYISQVCAWYQGSVHDAFLMRNSVIPQLMTKLYPERAWQVGGSAYPNHSWLLTPVRNPTLPREVCFNEAHGRTQHVVEWAFGLLKARFRPIDKTSGALHYSPAKMFKIIVACCMLHNLALRRNIPYIPDEGELAVPPGEPPEMSSEYDSDQDEGRAMQADLINQYFT